MSFLRTPEVPPLNESRGDAARRATLQSVLPQCANPRCRTGWMRLWRRRHVPGFEGQWACSAECMGDLVRAAIRRESWGAGNEGTHPHRIPIGLSLVEQGAITFDQLQAALAAQKQAKAGESLRLGQWLVRNGVLDEAALTRALGAQWSCPVFSLAGSRPEELASAMPQFLSAALHAVPVRVVRGQLLYVAFPASIDRSLAYAMERMAKLRVSCGVVSDSEFSAAQAAYLRAEAPRIRLLETAGTGVLARAVTKLIESEKCVDARLVRVHDYFWLRLWRRVQGEGLLAVGDVEDVLCRTDLGREDSWESNSSRYREQGEIQAQCPELPC